MEYILATGKVLKKNPQMHGEKMCLNNGEKVFVGKTCWCVRRGNKGMGSKTREVWV